MLTKSDIHNTLQKLEETIGQKLNTVVLIGGCVLVVNDLVPATKDLDTVVTCEETTFYRKIIGKFRTLNLNPRPVATGVWEIVLDNVLLHIGYPVLSSLSYTSPRQVQNSPKLWTLRYGTEVRSLKLEYLVLHKIMVAREKDLEHVRIVLEKTKINWKEIVSELKSHIRELVEKYNHRSELLGTEFMRYATRNLRRSLRELRNQIPENIHDELQEIAKEIEELKKRIRYRAT